MAYPLNFREDDCKDKECKANFGYLDFYHDFGIAFGGMQGWILLPDSSKSAD